VSSTLRGEDESDAAEGGEALLLVLSLDYFLSIQEQMEVFLTSPDYQKSTTKVKLVLGQRIQRIHR